MVVVLLLLLLLPVWVLVLLLLLLLLLLPVWVLVLPALVGQQTRVPGAHCCLPLYQHAPRLAPVLLQVPAVPCCRCWVLLRCWLGVLGVLGVLAWAPPSAASPAAVPPAG